MSKSTLINDLTTMAGTDAKGESLVSKGVARKASTLAVALRVEEDPTLSQACDAVAVGSALRRMRVALATLDAATALLKAKRDMEIAAGLRKAPQAPAAPAIETADTIDAPAVNS